MKRQVAILAVLAGVVLAMAAVWTVQPVYAQGDEHGEDEHGGEGEEFAPWRGAALYAEFCQACHGPQGEALGESPAFVAIEADPETAREAITNGVNHDPDDGVAMFGYGGEDGLLSEAQIDDLIAYIDTWGSDEVPALPEPAIHAAVDEMALYPGDPQAGAVVYATSCYGCHGPLGEGRDAPGFPGFEPSADVLITVNQGHSTESVPAFAESAGGPLTAKQVEDLDAYIASWALAEAEDKNSTPEGVSVLVVIMGLGAILVVGGSYWSRVRNVSTES